MKYYSTNNPAASVDLATAVIKGLAPDRGLYMPERIPELPGEFYDNISGKSLHEIACTVAEAMLGADVDNEALRQIVCDTLNFPIPLVKVSDTPAIYSLELYHGPTLAFKDVGARFMARLLQYFLKRGKHAGDRVNVLVATSGDTGSAVANGFLGVDGIHVYVLYPKGKVSPIQECQFATLGQNITAIEVDGVFDDCQALVKNAFMDEALNRELFLTSANSINFARLFPQSLYYFWAYSQLRKVDKDSAVRICVPSGNYGNITAAVMAWRMGLPVSVFLSANNANDVFYQFLRTGEYRPRPSQQTIANAMDVGDPSNFPRLMALFGNDYTALKAMMQGCAYSDDEIRATMQRCFSEHGYMLDPHGACAYQALVDTALPGEAGIFVETAHPAKFSETVENAIGCTPDMPQRLADFMKGTKQSIKIPNDYQVFRQILNRNLNYS